MGQAETDDDFRRRVLPLVDEADQPAVMAAIGADLDALGRRYGRFRTGMALAEGEPGDTERSPLGISWGQGNIPPCYVEVPAYEPPAPTVVGVPYPQDPVEDGPVRAYLIIGRLGLDHMLRYLFLGGDPSLAKVEALVRDQFNWPGDAVVVDLGQSYASHEAAEARVAAMREHAPMAVTFFVGDLAPHPASAAS